MAKQYSDRIILFIDFLAFKEIVKRTGADVKYFNNLLGAIDLLHNIGREDRDLYKTQRITTFSDSVVLSYATHERSAVFYLLHDISLTLIQLVAKGFLVRGAVTFGKLLHTQKYLVGPAMVRAYEMESDVARYPRIIVDPKLVAIAKKAHSEDHDPKHEAHYVRMFMTKDEDKQFYVDYFSWNSVIDVAGIDDDYYASYLHDLSKLIRAGLNNEDPKVLRKYLWMHKKYIAAIAQFDGLKPRHKYRLNNPENYAGVIGLPKMLDEMTAAAQKCNAYCPCDDASCAQQGNA